MFVFFYFHLDYIIFTYLYPSHCSYKRRNDEKTPGKHSDTNDESESHSAVKVKKQVRSKKMWTVDEAQQENQNVGDINIINKPNRRAKGGIAKALHYGNESVSSGSESTNNSSSVPLYR